MSLAAGDKLGPYEILTLIGVGGMGEVYRARDTRLGRDVAIKVSAQQFTERFEREARAIATLNHPNICTLYDVGPNYLVMEYIEGVEPKGPYPLEEALRIAAQIRDALEAAHEKGIVHRDLKPANIKIRPDGTVKVLDFGLAKVAEPLPEGRATDAPTLTIGATQLGVILGTAGYMSPEQARGKAVDKRADIWAFGVVLLEMLTGKPPFEGEDVGHTLAAVIMKEPDFGVVPAKVRRLLTRCLEKDPKKRLRDIGDAWELLEDAAPASAGAASRSSRTRLTNPGWILAGTFAAATLTLGVLHVNRAPEEVLKVSVLPPDRVTLLLNSVPAVSPDGRKLAFAAVLGGKIGLWLRDLSALDARLLPGTDGASLPFWSPDSRFIGFFANGKLKKVDSGGGPVLTLCDAANGRGGTWNKDDIIVFAPGLVTALYRVPAAGGTPTPVTAINDREPAHRYPWFLPDGRHFLYTAYLGPNHNMAYVGELNSPERKQVIPAASNVVYAAPGYLLFLRELALMAQPFEIGKLQIRGNAVPIAEQVRYSALDIRASFTSSQNGVLAYASAADAGNSQLTWFDRSGKVIGTLGAPGVLSRPAISPDGKLVAVSRRDPQTGLSDIWTQDAARGTNSRFTFNGAENNGPVWSPDGSRVAFYSALKGPTYIYQKAITGAGQEELLDQHSVALVTNDWSRDGRYVIEQAGNDPTSGIDLWVLPLFGSQKVFPYLKTPANEHNAKLSPDGHWLAYVSDESKRDEVYVQTFPSPGGKSQISTNGGTYPVWSRNGKELFYISGDGKMMAVDVKPGERFEAGVPKALFDTHLVGTGFDVTQDGRFLVATEIEQGGRAPLAVVVHWQAGLKK